MLTNFASWFADFWRWLRANDIPNWFAVAFTIVLWPVALFSWQRRKVNGVRGLEVHFAPGQISIAGQPYAAIDIQFTNHTGSVVYVSGVRVRNCSKSFVVPVEASRDIAENSYHLKFMNVEGHFVMREETLQTSASAKTCMPVSGGMSTAFFTYSSPWYARLLRRRKYFVLEYTAMVGTARHSVATLY
jgi:hypothetical protein